MEVKMRGFADKRRVCPGGALCMPGMLRAEGKPDLSSPQKAATAFALALQRGDF